MTSHEKDTESSARKKAQDSISAKAGEAAASIIELIRSIGVSIEQRIGLEDQVNDISKEAESMLGQIEDLTKANQRKILIAYRNFLQRNLEAVDQRLKVLG
jgi:hypothetical protein